MPIILYEEHEKNELVNTDPFSFLVAMLLDQQIPISWAFQGPQRIYAKLVSVSPELVTSNSLPLRRIADWEEESFVTLLCEKPTIHRYAATMARRIQSLAQHICEEYSGDAQNVWLSETEAETVFENLLALPGFGQEKSKITLAALGKRFDIGLDGWEEVAYPFSDHLPRTVADAGSVESFENVKKWKKEQRRKGLKKSDP